MIKYLQESESIIKIGYQPILIYFWQILAAIFLIVAPFFLMIPLFKAGRWAQIIFFFLICLGILFLIRIFFVWSKNVLIITNQSVIILKRRGFLDQQINRIGYEKIKDIGLLTKGIFQILTKSANLQINLISSSNGLKFNNLTDSLKIQDLIINLQKNFQASEEKIIEGLSGGQLINLARKIRDKLGPDLVKKIADEEARDEIDEKS